MDSWRIAVLAALLLNLMGLSAEQSRLPGFGLLTDAFWASPWVFDQGGTQLRGLHNSKWQLRSGPEPIRLEDGTLGTLRAESKPCAAGDDCAPFDCGCTLKGESFWIEIADRRGNTVARMHLWAAYHEFHIVPIDLVEGPGDELIIIRIPRHSSPFAGYEMKVWKVGRTKPVELLELHVADAFATRSNSCAWWRSNVFVNTNAEKPRSLFFRGAFAAIDGSPGCSLNQEEQARYASMRSGQRLLFVRGQYRAQ